MDVYKATAPAALTDAEAAALREERATAATQRLANARAAVRTEDAMTTTRRARPLVSTRPLHCCKYWTFDQGCPLHGDDR